MYILDSDCNYIWKSECSVAWVGSFGNFHVGLGLNLSVLFSFPTCSSSCWLPVAPQKAPSSPLGGLNVISRLFLLYCWPLISMTNESGTPTTLQMMMPCFHVFSMGLRHTHTLSPGSKLTSLVLDGSSKGCHSATSSGFLLCMIGTLEANLQLKNSSARLNLDIM